MVATARYWKKAPDELDLQKARKLRVNFGHFGDSVIVEDGTNRSEAFIALMSATADKPGAMAYADPSYFSDVLDNAARFAPF